ncbi:DL-glycerol-3-phosphatase 1 [Microthyrium microscopicum]|uniref:DL-glycerol-3-phosphatase 1 n=1 Tax=Microthyrium microscopicum TaxID=703497 RepID=A0A6A6U8G2_9PEZI|nr:DL-glycerol-3-phosphatase 1 [Microthyrium microscopicum]
MSTTSKSEEEQIRLHNAQELEQADFSAPPEILEFSGFVCFLHKLPIFLFDMDGTIIDSTEAIIQHWTQIASELNIDPAVILATSHGRRSIDVLAVHDPSKANWEYVNSLEAVIPKRYASSAVEIPGARTLLATLSSASAPWAIVTSGTRALVSGWLEVLGLTRPEHLVCAQDVLNGKPDPSCYQLGLKKIGMEGSGNDQGLEGSVLVVEDAPAGIRAGRAAGCKVLGLATSHAVGEVVGAGADWVVRDLSSVRFLGCRDGKARVEIRDALVR